MLLPLLNSGAVLILLNDPAHPGQFQPATTLSLPFKQGIDRIVASEMDGDGLLDLVIPFVNYMTACLIVYQDPQHPGTFTSPTLVHSGLTTNGQVFVQDMDNDGYPDIVFAGSAATSIVFKPGHVRGPYEAVVYPSQSADLASAYEVSDLNHDGLPDVLLGGFSLANQLMTFNSDPAHPGKLIASGVIPTASRAYQIEAFDLDADGYNDLLIGGLTDGLQWLRNDPASRQLLAGAALSGISQRPRSRYR